MKKLLIISLAFIVFTCSSAMGGSYTYHPNSVLKLGGTFDPENLLISYSSCILYDREIPVHLLGREHRQTTTTSTTTEKMDNLNGHTEISIEQIKTREQMYSFLNISTSISAHYAFFSGNANVNYESEGTFDESAFVFGIRGLTRYAEIGLLNPRLDSRATPLTRNLPALYSLCGREWVSQETRGVQIAVIYTIKNVSQSQRSRLEAAMSAGLDGGALFGGKLDARLSKILQQAFVSNYYTARVYAIGGGGIDNFASMITSIEEPEKVIQQMSAYIKDLKYENSVPMFFQTGLLEQFVAAEQGGKLVFDPVNRRLASLYVAYREYQARRAELWRYLNDDAQSLWEFKIDKDAWLRLKQMDSKLSVIEEKASYCKAAADIAQQLDARTHSATSPGTPPRRPGTPADTAVRDFLRSFSTGVSSRAVGQIANALTAQTSETAPPGDDCSKTQNAKDEAGLGASYLCQCQSNLPPLYVETRFPIEVTPHVDIRHDTGTFSPQSIIYVSVKGASALVSAKIVDRSGTEKVTLRNGYDPDEGAVWYGSVVYRTASGPPPLDTLPYSVEMVDRFGRVFTKPINE